MFLFSLFFRIIIRENIKMFNVNEWKWISSIIKKWACRISHMTSTLVHNIQTIIMIIISSAKNSFRVCREIYKSGIILMKIPRRWSIIKFCNCVFPQWDSIKERSMLKMMGYMNGRWCEVLYSTFSLQKNFSYSLWEKNIHIRSKLYNGNVMCMRDWIDLPCIIKILFII